MTDFGKIFGGIISGIAGLTAIITKIYSHLKYNSTRKVAEALIEAGEEHSIKKSSYKTDLCCWSTCMLISSCRGCCCTNNFSCTTFKNKLGIWKNESAESGSLVQQESETVSMYGTMTKSEISENASLVHQGNETNRTSNQSTGNSDDSSEQNSQLYQNSMELLVNTERHHPSSLWKDYTLDDKKALFNDMLKKCVPITYSNFLKCFQDYASFSQNRHSSFCRHPYCEKENHAKFTNCCSIEPICYYVVLDWNYLRIGANGLYL